MLNIDPEHEAWGYRSGLQVDRGLSKPRSGIVQGDLLLSDWVSFGPHAFWDFFPEGASPSGSEKLRGPEGLAIGTETKADDKVTQNV